MKNTKVVVMGPQDIAAMRRAAKEAEIAYFEAKVGALEFAAQEMSTTGEEYTATDLAYMTGLTPGEVAAQLSCGGCRAANAAGLDHDSIQTAVRVIENKYVRMMSDGEINPDQCIRVTRRQTTYKMRPGRNY